MKRSIGVIAPIMFLTGIAVSAYAFEVWAPQAYCITTKAKVTVYT